MGYTGIVGKGGQMTERRKGFGPMGYKHLYRLENSAGEVIADGNLVRQFIQLVEALGYAKVGETEQGFYEVDTPNGVVVHPSNHHLPQPLFEGVEGPVSEGHRRRVYKVAG